MTMGTQDSAAAMVPSTDVPRPTLSKKTASFVMLALLFEWALTPCELYCISLLSQLWVHHNGACLKGASVRPLHLRRW